MRGAQHRGTLVMGSCCCGRPCPPTLRQVQIFLGVPGFNAYASHFCNTLGLLKHCDEVSATRGTPGSCRPRGLGGGSDLATISSWQWGSTFTSWALSSPLEKVGRLAPRLLRSFQPASHVLTGLPVLRRFCAGRSGVDTDAWGTVHLSRRGPHSRQNLRNASLAAAKAPTPADQSWLERGHCGAPWSGRLGGGPWEAEGHPGTTTGKGGGEGAGLGPANAQESCDVEAMGSRDLGRPLF